MSRAGAGADGAAGPAPRPPPWRAAGGATGRPAAGRGPACPPSAAGLAGGPGTQRHLTHGLGPEPRAPSPDGQHQVHTRGRDRPRDSGGGRRPWSAWPQRRACPPPLRAAHLDLAERHVEGEGLVEVWGGRALPGRHLPRLPLPPAQGQLQLHVGLWVGGGVGASRAGRPNAGPPVPARRGQASSHLTAPGSGPGPPAPPRSAGPCWARTGARHTALPPAQPAGRGASLVCLQAPRAGPGRSQGAGGLTSAAPGGPSRCRSSRPCGRPAAPSGRRGSPRGSGREKRLQSSTCTLSGVRGSSRGGTCRPADEWALAARPSPPPPPPPAQTHAEAAGLVEHGAEGAMVHPGLVCAPSLGGQADAGVGVCRAARAPGPQVHRLLEAHPDLGAGVAQHGAPGWPCTPHLCASLRTLLPACEARPSPPGFQSRIPGTAAGTPTAGLPPGWTPRRPPLAAPGVGGALTGVTPPQQCRALGRTKPPTSRRGPTRASTLSSALSLVRRRHPPLLKNLS